MHWLKLFCKKPKTSYALGQNSIITETVSGIICANAGVDRSNVSGDRNVVPLPKNPSALGRKHQKRNKTFNGMLMWQLLFLTLMADHLG